MGMARERGLQTAGITTAAMHSIPPGCEPAVTVSLPSHGLGQIGPWRCHPCPGRSCPRLCRMGWALTPPRWDFRQASVQQQAAGGVSAAPSVAHTQHLRAWCAWDKGGSWAGLR